MNFDLKKIKNKLLIKYPYFGTIITNVSYYIDNSEKTAYTDGYDIYYNENFMNGLNENQQLFILAHEVGHIAFNHINRAQNRNHEIWNFVADAVLNAFFKDDGLELVEGGIDIPWAKEYNVEELYNAFEKNRDLFENLLSKYKKSQQQSQNSDSEENESNDSYGHDTHKYWGKKKSNSSGNETDEEKRCKKRIENEQEAINEDGEKKSFQKNNDNKQKKLEKLKEDIINKQSSQQAGSGPSNYLRKLREIGISKGVVDWRYILRDCVTFDLDWSYRNATFEDHILTPHLEELPKAEVEIVLDTSGSIDEELLKTFLRECKNILLNARVKVGCFDTQFYGFHTINNEKDINELNYQGGGGTDFDVAVSAFTRRVANKIIFTDGIADMPQNPPKIIWLVYGNNQINPVNGKVIYIDPTDLKRKIRR